MKNVSAVGWLVVVLIGHLALATLQYVRPSAPPPSAVVVPVAPVVPPPPDPIATATAPYLAGFAADFRAVAADLDAGKVDEAAIEPALGGRRRATLSRLMAGVKADAGGTAAGLRKAADAFDAILNGNARGPK